MPPTVKGLCQCRVDDFFNSSLTSIGVLPSICDALRKYDLFHYLQCWHRDSSFPTYTQWKSIVKTKIWEKENDKWLSCCQDHPGMHIALACLLNASPRQFWSLADDYPDLVSRLHIQVRIWEILVSMEACPGFLTRKVHFVLFAKKMSKM